MSKTYGEQFYSALKCQTVKDAKVWLDSEIMDVMDAQNLAHEQAKNLILNNIGYMAGYCDHEAAQKVMSLFGAGHSVFGGADYHRKANN